MEGKGLINHVIGVGKPLKTVYIFSVIDFSTDITVECNDGFEGDGVNYTSKHGLEEILSCSVDCQVHLQWLSWQEQVLEDPSSYVMLCVTSLLKLTP